MPPLNRSRQLYRQLLALFAASTLVTAIVVALALAIPFYQRDKAHLEETLLHTVENRALLVKEHLNKLTYVAMQISSRTTARRQLEAFINHRIDLEQLRQTTTPILNDARGRAPDILGISRLGPEGKRLVKVGIDIPPTLFKSVIDGHPSRPSIFAPVTIGNHEVVLIGSRIFDDDGQRLGTDITAFDIAPLKQLLNDREGLNHNDQLFLAARDEPTRPATVITPADAAGRPLPPELETLLRRGTAGETGVSPFNLDADQPRIAAFAPIKELPWGLAICTDASQLYGPARDQLWTLLAIVAALIATGLGATALLLRPLTGQILLRTDELEQRLHEHSAQLQRTNRALLAVRGCSNALIHGHSEGQMLQEVCNIIVGVGGYKLAWVGYAEEDERKSITPVANAGFEEGYLEAAQLSWSEETPRGRGPGGRAIRNKGPSIVRDILNDPRFEPWRDQARQRGYASVIGLPLISNDKAFGVMMIYAAERDAFDSEEIELLGDLADDIAFGVSALRAEAQRRETQQRLIESEARWRSLTEHSPDHIIMLDKSLRIEFANAAAPGLTVEQILGTSILDYIAEPAKRIEVENALRTSLEEGQPCHYETRYSLPDGDEIHYESLVLPRLVDGEVVGLTVSARNVTERRNAEARIEYLAYHDELTGLPNRRALMEFLAHTLAISRRHQLKGALMFLDLDRFKTINDSVGHAVGDAILQQVAQRLSHHVRETDRVARLGGDEFLMLLSELSHDTDEAVRECSIVGEKVRAILSQPYEVQGHEYHLSPSIGITLFPFDGEEIDDILKHADAAMYQAKAEGGNAFHFYHPNMQAAADRRLQLEKGLRRAVEREEFELEFQPLIDRRGEIAGAEALLRWHHPELGPVAPEQFIPIAEETGQILAIGQWVLQHSIAQLKQWLAQGFGQRPGFLAVNVSPRQFHHPDFIATVRDTLEREALPPELLKLEITENLVIENINETIVKMEALRQLGVHLAIDDFGTGYSSLSYLKRLPIDQIKIDKSFVMDITEDSNDAAIVETIIAIAQHMALEVVAEGVEDSATLALLQARACHYYQGHYFSPAIDGEQFARMMEEHHRFKIA